MLLDVREEMKEVEEPRGYHRLRVKLAAGGKGLDGGDDGGTLLGNGVLAGDGVVPSLASGGGEAEVSRAGYGPPILAVTWGQLVEGYRLLDQVLMLSQFDPSQIQDHHPEGTVNPEFQRAKEEGKRKPKKYNRDRLTVQKMEDLDELLAALPEVMGREGGVWLVRALKGSQERRGGGGEHVLGEMEEVLPGNRSLEKVREVVGAVKSGEGSPSSPPSSLPDEPLDALEKELRGDPGEKKPE
jgi:hypothetical protein